MLETDEQGDAILACGRRREEFRLVGAGGHVELAGDTEGLDVGEVGVGELVYDVLFLDSY